MKSDSSRCLFGPLLVFWMLFAASPANADLVELKLPSGILARAEYQPGRPDYPAVLLVHGFLQTHHFPLILTLVDYLSSSGYTVLAPTLSLGVNARNRSLSCEAPHTHTMEGDAAEIAQWVAWLSKQGHKQIALLGHSIGGFQVAAYLENPHYPKPKQVLLLSLTDTDHPSWAHQRAASLAAAKRRLNAKQKTLDSYALSFCQKYPASPESYISYAEWDRKRVLRVLESTPVPVLVILGGADDRMGRDWPALLRRSGAKVQVLEGANHFFDGEFEFAMAQHLEPPLRQLIQAP